MSHREDLDNIGKKILENTRTQLYLSMHFMGPALGSLDYVMDLSTTTVGTDAAFIRFNPHYLMDNYLVRPWYLNRVYMHMLMHCIFCHMFAAREYENKELWDLSCDIAAESVVDSMDYPAIRQTMTDKRAAVYAGLQDKVRVLTAQRLYRYYSSQELDYNQFLALSEEFRMDDHSFWLRMMEDKRSAPADQLPQTASFLPPASNHSDNTSTDQGNGAMSQPPAQLLSPSMHSKEEEWKKNAERIRVELETTGKRAGTQKGSLERLLSFTVQKRVRYQEYLKRFRILREETGVDPDSFDYGFYYYGLEKYGNMPLIEENEFRESEKIQQLAIAIDTSASCQDTLVAQFLNETATLLLQGERFFTRSEIHIIECDDQVQNDIVIHDPLEMKRYADGFSLKGGFGTDFRPVFRYIDDLQKRGELRQLKGLLYFTDGFGTYPEKPTSYDTAFVFWKEEEFDESHVPSWAMKLYM